MQNNDSWDEIVLSSADHEEVEDDLARIPLQFYVAHAPQYRPEIIVAKLEIDGIPLEKITMQSLPGQQGTYVELGTFPAERTIELAWEVHTNIANGVKANVGIFHGSMLKRTVLSQVVLETFSKYPGKNTLPVKYPAANLQSGVYIEHTWVYNQCEHNAQSVMLRNQSVRRYRVHILKQGDYDERISKALDPGKSAWLGCVGDGYSYTIERTEQLP